MRRTGRRGVNASAITVLDIKGGLTEEVTRVEIVPVPTVELVEVTGEYTKASERLY